MKINVSELFGILEAHAHVWAPWRYGENTMGITYDAIFMSCQLGPLTLDDKNIEWEMALSSSKVEDDYLQERGFSRNTFILKGGKKVMTRSGCLRLDICNAALKYHSEYNYNGGIASSPIHYKKGAQDFSEFNEDSTIANPINNLKTYAAISLVYEKSGKYFDI